MATISQAQRDGVVVGLGSTGPVLARLDIDQFMVKYPDTFNLFLLALQRLQGPGQEAKKMSFFQIAGIHGLPREEWDGVSGPGGRRSPGGYCTHGNYTFPTWHRPYVAMMEQTIYSTIQDVINDKFPNSTKYKSAAVNFRLPYWDPFRPRGGSVTFPGVTNPNGTTTFPYDFKFPSILTKRQVMILASENDTKLTAIPNPLFSYKFPANGGLPSDDQDLVQNAGFSLNRTIRHPNSSIPDGSDVNDVNVELNRDREGGLTTCWNLLSKDSYKSWDLFSNHGTQNNQVRGSIEGFHDMYHGAIGGGGGHMSWVPLAAFDPAFWLHHCNVDRLLAIWQGINPGTWIPDRSPGRQPASDTPLTPFRVSAGNTNFWDSDGSKEFAQLGYTYPEVQNNPSSNDILQDFARRYRWSLQASIPRGGQAQAPTDMQPLDVSKIPFLLDSTNIPTSLANTVLGAVSTTSRVMMEKVSSTVVNMAEPVLKATANGNPTQNASESSHITQTSSVQTSAPVSAPVAVGGTNAAPPKDAQQKVLSQNHPHPNPKIPEGAQTIREWYVDCEAKRNALNGAFTVFFFIGPFDDNPAEYNTQPSLAGIMHFFVAPEEACDNCHRLGEAGEIISNTTAITPILSDYVRNDASQLSSLEPDQVAPFLVKNLRWRVLKALPPQATDEAVTPIKPSTIAGFKVHVNSDLCYLETGSYVPVEIGDEDFDDQIVAHIPQDA